MRPPAALIRALLFSLILGAPALGCSDSSTVPEDAAPGHTVVEGGVAHAPGLNNPLQNCTSCHGANLQGGSAGQPSCTSCHGVKW